MHRLLTHALVVSLIPVAIAAQAPGTDAPRAQAEDTAASTGRLPVKRIVLYKNGVGFFEHIGRVTGSQVVRLDFTSEQLDDVLKSLTVLDLDGGRVTAVGYNSNAPLERQLGALRLPLGTDPSAPAMLGALVGARVEVVRGGTASSGRLLGVERRRQGSGAEAGEVDYLSIVTDAGEVRLFELGPATSVRLLERELRERVGRYLGLVAAARDGDRRRMTLDASGQGTRRLYVSYVSEVPVWKTTYRLVLPGESGRKPLLQGWAIVDNTVGEDWNDVELSLVAGAPVSFIQQLSQPYYTVRPVMPLPSSALLAPQTHQATMSSGQGVLVGLVKDSSGGALPGADIRVFDTAGRLTGRATTGADGRYRVSGLASGIHRVHAALPGFTSASHEVEIAAGREHSADLLLEVAALTESVSVAAESAPPPPPPAAPVRVGGNLKGRAGGVVGGMVGGLPESPSQYLAQQQAAATAVDLGDLFEYRVQRPVTIRQNQSALVPILQADVTAEKVSLWTENGASGERPLSAVWLTNSSGLTLDAGTFTVLDRGTFAGEGVIEAIKAGERRLLSYAVDLAVRVSTGAADERRRISRVRAAGGVLTHDVQSCAQRTYTIRNEDDAARTLVLEHALRPGWTLGPGTPGPDETSSTAYRFKARVEPGKTTTLTVAEVKAEESRIAVSDAAGQQLALLVQNGRLGEQGLRALRSVMAKRDELAAVDAELAANQGETRRIAADQGRVRENMKSLKGSEQEKRLVERYVRQINAQEDRLEALRAAASAAERRRTTIRQELTQLVEALAFDTGTDAADPCAAP